MFSLSIKWRWRPDNPCKGVERNPEKKRHRYLSGAELAALTGALAEHPDQQAADIIRLLLLTGARRGEVLSAKWEDLDLETGVWSKPASATKQKTPHRIPLSAPARQLWPRCSRPRRREVRLSRARVVVTARASAKHGTSCASTPASTARDCMI